MNIGSMLGCRKNSAVRIVIIFKCLSRKMAKKILCLIAARGGSKRLPGKNVMMLDGRPLVAHSVEQAKACGVFETVAVSSDDKAILKAAAGADMFIQRPDELATDEASSLDVIIHAIKEAGEG